MSNSDEIIQLGRKFLSSEINALEQVSSRLDTTFSEAVQAILDCQGTVILAGVGKPYFVAQKISASMASTGTQSIPLHPVDALHGDMGRIKSGDVIVVLSNSGSSSETVDFVRATKGIDVTRIAITCRPESAVATECDIVLDLGPLQEACPMGVAPSTTSTAMLALGDALTLSLVELREFTIEAFAKNHPGGQLGRRLSPASTIMRGLDATATVNPTQTVLETVSQIAEKRSGAAFIVNEQRELLGVLTDGDLKRLVTSSPDALAAPVEESMTRSPKTIRKNEPVEIALDKFRTHHINILAVVDEEGTLLGHLDIQDVA